MSAPERIPSDALFRRLAPIFNWTVPLMARRLSSDQVDAAMSTMQPGEKVQFYKEFKDELHRFQEADFQATLAEQREADRAAGKRGFQEWPIGR